VTERELVALLAVQIHTRLVLDTVDSVEAARVLLLEVERTGEVCCCPCHVRWGSGGELEREEQTEVDAE